MGSSSDDELIELLTCHRPASCPNGGNSLLCHYLVSSFFLYHHMTLPEASLGPYAWERPAIKQVRSTALQPAANGPQGLICQHLPLESDFRPESKLSSDLVPEPRWEDRYLEHDDLKNLQRSKEVFRKIEMDPCLSLCLPKPGVNAGRVLDHGIQTFQNLHSKNKPMTFKFGWTHDAAVRWHNNCFWLCPHEGGQVRFHGDLCSLRQTLMDQLFLEACLIDRFGSCLFALAGFQTVSFSFADSR